MDDVQRARLLYKWLRLIVLLPCLEVAEAGPSLVSQSSDLESRTPWGVAARLARAGVAAGVVMCVQMRELEGAGADSDDFAIGRESRSPFDDKCRQMNANLRRSNVNGVAHFRVQEEPASVTSVLRMQITMLPEIQISALEAVTDRVISALRGRYSTASTPPVVSCGMSLPVAVTGGKTTVQQALDDVVRQVQGVVWLLTFTPKQGTVSMQLGLVCADGTLVSRALVVAAGESR